MNPYESRNHGEPSPGPRFLSAGLRVISFLSGTIVIFLVLMGPFAWLLRDGLGPEATASNGWSSITRMFWTFYWGPATLIASITCVVAFLCHRRMERQSG